MGTRSLTYIEESRECPIYDEEYNNKTYETKQNILCMYRQYDGYLSGYGMELAKFLQDFTVVNGYNSLTPKRSANGMGCLAAQLIAHFKDGIGNVYIYHPDAEDCGEEYTYTISKLGKDNICIKVHAISGWGEDYAKKLIFEGTPKQLIEKVDAEAVEA